MSVRRAQKLDLPKDQAIRGFSDTGAQPPSEYVYLKDAFEYGGHSQLYVGAQRVSGSSVWRRRIFKCVSALPAQHEHGMRHTLALERAEIRQANGQQPSTLPWQVQGMMRPTAIAREIAAVRACNSPFARATEIVATMRAGAAEPSKYFYIMPLAESDLLGCIRMLETQSPAMRRNVALMALRQLAAQMLDLHVRQGRAHGDVRAENVLCIAQEAASPHLLLWDFGLAVSGMERDITPYAFADMGGLGKIFARLLAPDFRELLDGDTLPSSLTAICSRYPDLAPILRGLLTVHPELRWTARELSDHLQSHVLQDAPGADPAAFMPQVRQLKQSIDAKWDILKAYAGEEFEEV